MTKHDLKRRFANGLGDQMGVAGWCVLCGCNLMCAPLKHVLDEVSLSNGAWEHCFSVCRNCGAKNPPVDIRTFNDEEFRNDSWRRKR